jgi:hypothetical protein
MSSSSAAAVTAIPTSPPHACPTSGITAGDHVVVHGLQKAHELNGCRGRVDGYRGQRCIVCVSGSKKLVLPINLRRVAAGPIAGASTAPVDSDSSGASTMRQPHSSLSDDSSSSDDEPDSAPPSAALAARPSFMTARGGTAAVSRVRARDDDPEDDDDQGLGSASALRGGGFISASQSKGTVRPRSTTAGWNGRQNQCGVFMNARAERVHISEESRRKGAEIWCAHVTARRPARLARSPRHCRRLLLPSPPS